MNKALFLDRDGVINIEKNYLYKIEDFEFIDGIFELCRSFQDKGYLIFVVTNQSGIARGYYTEEDFNVLSEWMVGAFKEQGIGVTHVYHCPHHPDISATCDCRKPNPGMLLEAAAMYKIDLKESVLIGDKERDIDAAFNAGLDIAYLYAPSGVQEQTKATHVVTSLKELTEPNENY